MAWWRRQAVALAALWLLAAPASGAGELSRLARLLQQGDYAAAYALARQHRGALEGDPRFDYLYGVAALESGNPGEAVFALRRALALRPGIGVRLQLARAWLGLGQDQEARRELEQVLARDPPAPVRARVERYLGVLDRRASRYRRTITGHVEIGAGHDTNVTTATEAEAIEHAGGLIVLDDLGGEARAQHDDFLRLSGELRVSQPFAPGLGGFLALDGERRWHGEWDALEIGHARLRSGLTIRGERLRTELAAHGRSLYLDGARYRDTIGLDVRARYAFSGLQVAQAALGFSRLHHVDGARRARDADLTTVVLGGTRIWRAWLHPTLSLFVLHGRQRPATESADPDPSEQRMRAGAERDVHGLGGELRLRLAPRWVARGALQHRRSDYPEADPVFERARDDDYTSAELALQWHPGPYWRLHARLRRVENDSNIDLHDYQRDLTELGLRYRF